MSKKKQSERRSTTPASKEGAAGTAGGGAAALVEVGKELVEVDPEGPHWLQASFPWMVSLTFNLGFFLLAVFVAYISAQELTSADGASIIVPNSFEDPALSEHPGGIPNQGLGSDPTKVSAQDRLKEIANNEGWAQNNTAQNVTDLLQGQAGDVDLMGIVRGSGGSTGADSGNGNGGTRVAAYGAPGGGGTGPRSSFYGTGGNATKIVYIIDHSGSMLDNFDFLKVEMGRSVNKLVPLQYFSVVLVSDKVSMVGPPQLQRALPDAKKTFVEQLSKERAEGQNDDLLIPFQQAFERAFAMKPELIYFLTDGRFGEGLVKIVNDLNKDKKVHINTIAFVTEEPSYKGQLEDLANENGGSYKFIPEKDLGK